MHGKGDIWDFVFSRSDPAVEYVHVRDLDRDIVYAGWVRAYSDTGRLRELLLTGAVVYGKNGEEVGVPLLYLARPRSDVHIEFPAHGGPEEPVRRNEGGHNGERP